MSFSLLVLLFSLQFCFFMWAEQRLQNVLCSTLSLLWQGIEERCTHIYVIYTLERARTDTLFHSTNRWRNSLTCIFDPPIKLNQSLIIKLNHILKKNKHPIYVTNLYLPRRVPAKSTMQSCLLDISTQGFHNLVPSLLVSVYTTKLIYFYLWLFCKD